MSDCNIATKGFITKICLYNFDPLKPDFYIVKLGFTGVYIFFVISAQKHRLWVLVRTASPRCQPTHNQRPNETQSNAGRNTQSQANENLSCFVNATEAITFCKRIGGGVGLLIRACSHCICQGYLFAQCDCYNLETFSALQS